MYSTMSLEMTLTMLAVAAAASFFLGNAMNSILGAVGFGVLGNMVILFFGYLLGRGLLVRLPYRTVTPELHIPTAIFCAFASLFLLVVIKRVMEKV
ncbi:hypothetical protein E2A64_13950 [Pseudohoeflea suaedae]|uniref:GlsB/YeaQ/YmgE family stress response membrane protein n=1 Tax=Pseudohoeflea suaedae TaxID=877384 RepID=A0A4R5PHZ6_9HYPH|nr:hypothetical protein [Pseudohoeflea suaedae]TDH34843.1 hypothetical protein E2A64_13950 [Pseudohoeflea suaedae]